MIVATQRILYNQSDCVPLMPLVCFGGENSNTAVKKKNLFLFYEIIECNLSQRGHAEPKRCAYSNH